MYHYPSEYPLALRLSYLFPHCLSTKANIAPITPVSINPTSP